MPVTDVITDPENLTLTILADFAAPVERVWAAYSDPRQLERFWGPPGWPATFTEFDHTVGGFAQYRLTGPRGEKSSGRWEFTRIEAPTMFEVLDSFVDDAGQPIDGFPAMRMRLEFSPTAEGTRMTGTSHFDSVEALDQVVAMGVIEGTKAAMAQLDAVLQDLRDYAQGKGTQLEVLDDTHVRITRLVDGPQELVWRAHTDPRADEEVAARSRRLGVDGVRGGDRARSDLSQLVGTGRRHPPRAGVRLRGRGADRRGAAPHGHHREDAGHRGPVTLNDLSLYEEDGATLITLLVEYPRRRHPRHDPRHGHDRRHGGLVRPHGGPRPGLTHTTQGGTPGRPHPPGGGGAAGFPCIVPRPAIPSMCGRRDAVRSRDVRRRGEDPPRRGRADPRGGGRVEDARASIGGTGAAAHADLRAARRDPVRRGRRAHGAVVVHGRRHDGGCSGRCGSRRWRSCSAGGPRSC